MKHQTLFFLQKIKKRKIKVSSAASLLVSLTFLHSERPKLYGVLAFLSAIGLKNTSTVIPHFIKGTTMVISSCFPGGLSLSNSLLFPFKNYPQLRRNA